MSSFDQYILQHSCNACKAMSISKTQQKLKMHIKSYLVTHLISKLSDFEMREKNQAREKAQMNMEKIRPFSCGTCFIMLTNHTRHRYIK